jgi:hypothetical protein
LSRTISSHSNPIGGMKKPPSGGFFIASIRERLSKYR